MTVEQSRPFFQLPSHDWWVDTRMISPMRLVLAATALLVIYIDPSQPDRLVGLTYSLLVAYTVYSAILLVMSWAAPRYLPFRILHWLDLIWYVALISVSSGTSSIFFLFFFFAILCASFRWGSASGMRTTIVSAVLFVGVGYLTAPAAPQFELNRFVLRAVTLLVLGYMIAHWGGSESELKRRLTLLKDVTNFSNPRFGIEQTIRTALERLRSFYDARSVVLIVQQTNRHARLTTVHRDQQEIAREDVSDELASLLLEPEPEFAIIRRKHSRAALSYDTRPGAARRELSSNRDAVASYLDAGSFASIPVKFRGQYTGRLYIVDSHRRLTQGDLEFVLQVIEHVTPLLDNIGLLDRLASDAAEQERKKLARDIHDSVIQPYVGLQLGLAAVRQKLLAERSTVFGDVNELCEVANEEVRGLRHYLNELKAEEGRFGVLLPAVRRFAEKYSAATGIAVQIMGQEDLRLNDRLAAEVFQLVIEGLSNIRRHTVAQTADIEIRRDERDLILNIRNENANADTPKPFHPVSITERTLALGGNAELYRDHDKTVVAIRIPL